jgi:3-methyl-2-oxobutanoate hydroxymethyltransferase
MYGPPKADVRLRKITAPELRARKGHGPAITMITAYDYTMARLVDAAGADMILVGDSLGMIVQGEPHTLGVTVEEVCYHGRCVARGVERAHLVGDMPFMSYQLSPTQALENAGRLVKEGRYESVKLEGGAAVAEHVARIVAAGIPVVGHVGLTPQSVHALGGFRVQGRGEDAEARIVADAKILEEAGAFCIVLEAIPPDLAEAVTRAVSVPTIGIGAGAACDGQVLVCTDMLGMGLAPAPKFTKRFAELGKQAFEAFEAYVREVRDGTFPGPEHAYKPNRGAAPSEAPPAPSTAEGSSRAAG